MPDNDYSDLVRRFPLVSIRSAKQLKEAQRIIDELSIQGEAALSDGQADYLNVLGDLADAYESEQFNEWLKNVTGLDLLKHEMDSHDLSASDIGKILGLRELGSKIFRGERQISRAIARKLGEHFNKPHEMFLR